MYDMSDRSVVFLIVKKNKLHAPHHNNKIAEIPETND